MRYIALSLFVFVLFSCAPSPRKDLFEITSYNAYAFFDDYEDGDEYDGFSHRDGYNGEAYFLRVKELAVLLGRSFASSDVILLQEIESTAVLEDLLEAGLKEKGFIYYGLAEGSEGTLFTGFISRSKPLRAALHGFPDCRPILELVFLAGDEIIHVFGVHFRSRIDDGREERTGQAEHLVSLMERCSGSLAVAAGDFNTDPVLSEDGPFALFPEHYDSENAFHITGDPSGCGPELYFSPMHDPDAVLKEKGTYFHDGIWYCYDAIYLSEESWDGEGWEFYDAVIMTNPAMKDHGGRPMPYDASTGFGYSDHFPVTVRLCLQ